MNLFQGCLCGSEEKDMENTQPTTSNSGFFAVVLRRDHEDAEEAEVLISSHEYRSFPGRRDTKSDIVLADHLGKAAKREAIGQNPDLQFRGHVLVYADNPTSIDPSDLTYRANVPLNPECKALNGETPLATCGVPRFYVLVTAAIEQQAERKVDELDDSDLFRSICEGVENTMRDCMYRLPTAFELPEGHPFASGVNDRNIPCYPNDPSRPYLLMEGLAPGLQNPKDKSHISAADVRLIPFDEKQALCARMLSDPTVLFGVSGAGKTQLLYELLAEKYGLLFEADRGGNDGCADLGDAVQDLKYKLSEVPTGPATDADLRKLESNLDQARHTFQAVVLARLLLLRALKRKIGHALHPGLWLWMQLHPGSIFEQSPDVATLFDILWRDCAKLSQGFISRQCFGVSGEILESGGVNKLPCFVDEAHVLLEKLPEGFPSSSDPEFRRSCFSALATSLREVCIGPLMAGTRVRMAAATKQIATALAGKPGVSEKAVEFGRRGHLSPDDCRAYILRYLGSEDQQVDGVAPQELEIICQTLQGRPRFTERFVSLCLENGHVRGAMELFEELVNEQVKGEPMQHAFREHRSKLSIYRALEALHRRLERLRNDTPTTLSGQSDIMADFRSVALRYAMTGEAQVLTRDEHFQLVECGMANIDFQKNSAVVSICEPIVVRAARNYFGLLV